MKRKLLFAMLCIVSALGLNAQVWTAADVAEGEFYLYNVGRGQFFTKGNGWGTQASITDAATVGEALGAALKVTLVAVDGDYQIVTGVNNAAYGLEHLSGGTLYTDQSRNKKSTWTFTQVSTDNGPVYSIVSKDNHGGGAGAYASANDENTVVGPAADATLLNARWKLMDVATANMLKALPRYSTIKDAAKTIIPSLDTTTPDGELASATTADEVNAAIATLRAAFVAALSGVTVPSDPGYIDVTDVMVDNAGVHTNTEYWTIDGTKNGGYSFGVCNYGECEFYNTSPFKFYQTLTLDKGTWEFGVTGFHRAGNHSTYFYAGTDKILIPGVANTIVNSMAEAKDYFDAGNGKVALKFGLEAEEDKTIEIGIDNQDTQTDKWTIFRDFTLKYFGPAVDYTAYKARWDEAVTAASEAKTAYPNVTGDELTALNDALDDAPDSESKKADYTSKTLALTNAVNAYNAAGPNYEAYATYKAETVALFGTDFSVAAPTTAAEAVAAVAALNTAQYNEVATNYTFSLNGLIGDFGSWTGTATVGGEAATPNYLNWEHWSGQQHAYYEQASNGWGNATGWTIQYEKTCRLPKGKYVLKVAARSSAGTTSKVTCSATETVIALPSAGNNTRGINTSGEASWSDDDEFANTGSYTSHPATVGGTGAGWQWRFLPFEITGDDKVEVTMTFYAEASTQYQWMSISDGELLCTEDVTDKVSFDEEKNNSVEDYDIANVTIYRTIHEGYNTMILPFNLGVNQVEEVFGKGATVYNYSENSEDAEKTVVNFKKGDGSINANVPVLVKAPEDKIELVFKGVQVIAPEDEDEIFVEGKNIDFVGSYRTIAKIAADNYFLNNGKIYKSEGKTGMKAFRAYLRTKSADVRAELFIDGVATAIDAIDADNSVQNGAIYNLAGQRVQKAQRGLYIVNGKKVVIK